MKRRLSQIVLLLLCAVCVMGAMPAARAEGTDFSAWGVFDFALVSGTDKLNLRTGPGKKYDVISLLPAGEKMKVVGKTGSWYKVTVGKQTGYVMKKLVRVK